METQQRIYDSVLTDHLARHRQMVLVSGPRQVGKTTTCRGLAQAYVNWDNVDHREHILKGPGGVIERFGLNRLSAVPPTVLFDELHKFPRWKQFLKGLFDTCSESIKVIVTGSSRMNAYCRGGDSLMGRYLSHRMHPFSVAEIAATDLPDSRRILRPPSRVKNADFDALWNHGGYPEPFLKRDVRFSRRWQSLRFEQVVREDIRDLTQIQQIDQMEVLVRVLAGRSASQIVYGNLARDVRVSIDTIRRWVAVLRDLHLGFLIRPWFKNVSRSLRKEPKWYLRDWAAVGESGPRAETFVACHLLKAIDGWNDLGLGSFELGYLRDKEKREVDFIVIRDGTPWFLVEVQHGDERLSKALGYYQEQLGVPFAFQVVIDNDHVDADCFTSPGRPLIVPARTFLSQLL